VFPARYELNSYIVFRKRLVSRRLTEREDTTRDYKNFCDGKGGYSLVKTSGVSTKKISGIVNKLKRWKSVHRHEEKRKGDYESRR
jgi:hypothetical protein